MAPFVSRVCTFRPGECEHCCPVSLDKTSEVRWPASVLERVNLILWFLEPSLTHPEWLYKPGAGWQVV